MKPILQLFDTNSLRIIMLLLLLNGAGSASAQTIPPTDGGAPGVFAVPPGWTNISLTTDIHDLLGFGDLGSIPGFNWVAVAPPPNGHQDWIGGWGYEEAGTTITGLVTGQSYTFTFYMCELQNSLNGNLVTQNYDGELQVNLNGSIYTFSFTGGNNHLWSQESINFVATAPTMSISFSDQITWNVGYGNFWNVSFDSSAVTVNNCNATAPVIGF